MGISRYPRFGQVIAPVALQEVLAVTVPYEIVNLGVPARLRLCDLDETSWSQWGSKVCHNLSQAVVQRVRSEIPSLPLCVLKRLIPPLPLGLGLDDLELERRTRNCLEKVGLLKNAGRLEGWTIGDLLGIRAFGAKSLVDILASLESSGFLVGGVTGAELERSRQSLSELAAAFESVSRLCSQLHGLMTAQASMLNRIESADTIRQDDPRLGTLLQAADRDARDVPHLVRRMIARAEELPEAQALCARIREILQASDKIGRLAAEFNPMREHLRGLYARAAGMSRLTLEQELNDLVVRPRRWPVTERDLRVLRRRLGVDGHGGRTLEATASEFGVTRERVRQICTNAVKHLKDKRPFAPLVDRALALVVERLPATADDVEKGLQSSGITETPFRLEGLMNVADLLGREPPFAVTSLDGIRLAVPSSELGLPEFVRSIARRSIQHWGAATIEDVAAQVCRARKGGAASGFVSSVLQTLAGFRWIDQTTGWFWLDSVLPNRLLNNVRKILAVAGFIHVSELRQGIGRHHRMEGFAPPRRVLLEFCRQAQGFRVDGDTVIADPPLDWRQVLRGLERALASVLKESGPVMDRPKLEEVCVRTGMKKGTFYVLLDHSPILTRLARGVYALRGAPVPPGLVESLTPSVRRGKVLVDYGWTPERKIWLVYKVSKAMISSGMFTIPVALKSFVEGEFDLTTADGSPIGRLISKDNGAHGLRPFFARRGGDAGDYLVLLFDLEHRTATVTLGDANLVSDAQGGAAEAAAPAA